jgi:chemotaxis protein MotB
MPEKLPHGKKPGIADSDEKNADARAQSRWAQNRKIHFVQDADHTSPALVLQFDEASAELTKQSIDQLNRLIPVLLGKQNRIEIRGHSTRRPLPRDSAYKDLWQLCFARSMETMKYLADHGVEPDRLRLSQAGASEPVTNRIESAWQKENARVEVFLLTEMADDAPGVEKGAQSAAIIDKPDVQRDDREPSGQEPKVAAEGEAAVDKNPAPAAAPVPDHQETVPEVKAAAPPAGG